MYTLTHSPTFENNATDLPDGFSAPTACCGAKPVSSAAVIPKSQSLHA